MSSLTLTRKCGAGFLNFCPRPLGGEGGPQPALSPAGAGRVRGSQHRPLPRSSAVARVAGEASWEGRSKRRAASFDSNCFAVPALAMDTSELGRTGCFRWIHGLDPLTRRAPAGENAGCAPPSPPRGRGLGMHNGHSSEDAAYRFTNVETPVFPFGEQFTAKQTPHKHRRRACAACRPHPPR